MVLHPIEWGGRDPPLQDRIEASREQPLPASRLLKSASAAVELFGWGPPLQGKSFASGGGRRCKGISSAAWFRVLLQHAGAVHPCTARTKSPCSDVLRDRGGPGFGEAWQSRHRRSHGPSVGERRGGAGIGRKQAMDGLRSPVGAMDGGIRRCARSPHCRGSPRSKCTPALFALSGSNPVGRGACFSWMRVRPG